MRIRAASGGYPPRIPAAFLTARAVRALDIGLALWCAAWIGLAVAVGQEVRGLGQVSETVVEAGAALEEAGGALVSLESVPFVGDDVVAVGEQTQEAGRSARRSGRASRDSVNDLSILLALSIGVVPTLPLLALYVPFRVARARETERIRTLLETQGRTPELDELLARRAAYGMPYHRVLDVTRTPARELDAGRHEALAQAELERLGLADEPPRATPGG